VAGNYRVNPNYVPPEPTAAKFFATISEEEYQAGEHERIFEGWRKDGVQQVRLTLINDQYPNPPYPHGVWIEGWTDKRARMLPFGEAEEPGGAIYPPLVADNGKLRASMA
jgi:hypothetical protein